MMISVDNKKYPSNFETQFSRIMANLVFSQILEQVSDFDELYQRSQKELEAN